MGIVEITGTLITYDSQKTTIRPGDVINFRPASKTANCLEMFVTRGRRPLYLSTGKGTEDKIILENVPFCEASWVALIKMISVFLGMKLRDVTSPVGSQKCRSFRLEKV